MRRLIGTVGVAIGGIFASTANAVRRFFASFQRKVEGMTMQAASSVRDFSFDFQDLDFKKTTTGTAR
jgi:hypothetical protein